VSVWEAAFWIFIGAWSVVLLLAVLVLVTELRSVKHLLEAESRAQRARRASRQGTS